VFFTVPESFYKAKPGNRQFTLRIFYSIENPIQLFDHFFIHKYNYTLIYPNDNNLPAKPKNNIIMLDTGLFSVLLSKYRRKQLKIALGQINPVIGDFQGNVNRIIHFTEKAAADLKKPELIVFPELSICGYPPMDLLDQEAFLEKNLKALREIQHGTPRGLGIVIGYVDKNKSAAGKRLMNTVSVIEGGQILFTQAKTLLPTYDVFDEARYFEPAAERKIFRWKGRKIGIAICEDIWWETEPSAGVRYPVDPVKDLLDMGASLILVPSASPYYAGKPRIRCRLLSHIGRSSGVGVVYVNMVGGNDSLIFDGQSMIISGSGRLTFLGKAFDEELVIVDTESKTEVRLNGEKYDELERALILGIRDYLEKCGFCRVHLGLSGGIDSALVAVLAVKALGADNVKVFALPSRYSSEGSLKDAQKLADNLGIELMHLPIESIFTSYLDSLKPLFNGRDPDITEENLQARIRGTLLMAYSNKYRSLLLATGNKSELATGYCTLYGDMAGSLAVIGDLLKTEVYKLADYINHSGEIIPRAILNKPPSAELRPDQTDQDTLPPYDILDKIIQLYIVENLDTEKISERGFKSGLVERVITMIKRAEYKRRQAPVVLKVSPRAFGTGRRIPIAAYGRIPIK